ncbi:MAG TPA: phosphoribosylformylglycinamidine synthase subunit PurL, partial [Chitinophagaceae bacterium]|nr:phosphoribosylformylglycinamidine synthase subunit PurL [Chitinophagaceae bacterium]
YTDGKALRSDAFWFGEAQSRVVVTVAEEQLANFLRHMSKSELPFAKLGTVTNGKVIVDGQSWGAIELWKEKYDTSIENYLAKEEAGAALSAI